MSSSKFRKYFKGKVIGVLTRSIRGSQHTEGGTVSGNQLFEGLYLDEDKYFLFISNDGETVSEAIHKKDIVRVSLVDIIDNFPETSGEIN